MGETGISYDDRRISVPTPARSGEEAEREEPQGLDPARIYFRRTGEKQSGSAKASRMWAYPERVCKLGRMIAKETAIVSYRGEILTPSRLMEVVEAARAEAEDGADAEPEAQDAA
jgi:hypothetical protein